MLMLHVTLDHRLSKCSQNTEKPFLEVVGLTWAENGIFFPTDERGSSTGDCYVQFATFTEANQAMERNRNTMGSRYIELFKSNSFERRTCLLEQKQMEAANPWCQPTFSHNNFNAPKANWGGLTLSSQGGGSMPGSIPQIQRT